MPLSLDVRETRGFIFLKLKRALESAGANTTACLRSTPTGPRRCTAAPWPNAGLARDNDCKRDKAAALALDPDVEQKFKRYGVN